jgi:hypothetical protein
MGCTAAGNGGQYVCTEQNGLPTACVTTGDCAALGVGCFTLPIVGGLCLKLCSP